jgi:hypothetical protein
VLIPIDTLSIFAINDAQANHLLLCPGAETALFWIASNDGEPVAVFLNGPYLGHGFRAASGSNWSGVQIGPVALRVDPASVHDDRSGGGGLKAANGKLLAPVIVKDGGFNESTYIDLGEFPTLKDSPRYFLRWSLGMEIDGEWNELVKFEGKSVNSVLVPAKLAKVEIGGV